MTELKERNKQYKKISAEITIDFFEQIDKKAHQMRISKSELIRQALFQFINA